MTVYLLFLRRSPDYDAVLGVFATDADARIEALEVMADFGGPWLEVHANGWLDVEGRWIHVEARDVHSGRVRAIQQSVETVMT